MSGEKLNSLGVLPPMLGEDVVAASGAPLLAIAESKNIASVVPLVEKVPEEEAVLVLFPLLLPLPESKCHVPVDELISATHASI